MGRTKTKQPDPADARNLDTDDNVESPEAGTPETIPPNLHDEQSHKLDLILKEIKDTRSALETQIGTISVGLNLLKADHKNLSEKVKANKLALDDLIPQHTLHQSNIAQLQNQIKGLQDRVDDAEGRSRRNNIRILGLPEKCEGRNPIQFAEQWLKDYVTTEGLTGHFSVERAHRLPARPLQQGRPARPFIVRILDYKDRDLLLRKARDKAPISYENKTISLYPDYTLSVQKVTASFLAAKRQLREHNLKYALLFPARLKVIHDQKSLFFESPEEVIEWLEITFTSQASAGTSAGEPPRPQRQRLERGTARTRRDKLLMSQQAAESKRDALQTVAELTDSGRQPLAELVASSDEERDQSDSDNSMALFPDVTPQTANDYLG